MISDEELLSFNSQGLIPGPQEEETAFLQRAKTCLDLRTTLIERFPEARAFSEMAPPDLLKEPLQACADLYDISPSWVPLFFSNRGLSPWHGGMAWICQPDLEKPAFAFIQLRRSFASGKGGLGLYARDELIAHELCHIGRMAFFEPSYEEIFASQTAPKSYRRYLGGLLDSAWESWLFFFSLLLATCLPPFFLGQGLLWGVWVSLLPLSLLVCAGARLAVRHFYWRRCRRRIEKLFGKGPISSFVMFRLTDREIVLFGTLSAKEIVRYAQESSRSSLRWRLLVVAYFSQIRE